MKKKTKKSWINAVVASHRNATVALLTAEFYGHRYEAGGAAKRETGDVFNLRIGNTLAVSRALRDLADQLEREAAALVENASVDKIIGLARPLLKEELGPKPKSPLTIEEISEKYGEGAAAKALTRRTAQGGAGRL
jgi:hypothetical protein